MPPKKERTRKRKLEIDPDASVRTTPKRQTRSSTAAVNPQSSNHDPVLWTMFKGYDKKEKRVILQKNRTSECNEEVQVSLPPKLMNSDEVPSTGKVNSYSKTHFLQTITEVLNGSENWELLKKSSLFNVFKIPLKRGALSGRLLHYMLGRMVLTRKKYEIWFVFGNRPIKYSLREFALVTGLNCGPYPAKEKDWTNFTNQATSEEAYWWDLFTPLGLTNGSVAEIVTYLIDDKKKPQRKQISEDLRFRLCLIVLIDGVLCPKNSATVKVSPTTVEMTRNIDEFLNFPWGRLSFELSLEMVRVGSSSNYSIDKFLQRYHQTHTPMKGLSIGFQLVFFKAVPTITAYLSKPSKDTYFGDPSLKEKDLKDCRDIKNTNLEYLENDSETDVYSIIPHGGYQLVHNDFTWEDEVDDISVDLLEFLLQDGYVFKSSDWVKGTIDLPKCRLRVIAQGERLPTKKAENREGDGEFDIEDMCESEEDEQVECENGDLVLLKKIHDEGFSKIQKYMRFVQKEGWNKFVATRKQGNNASEEVNADMKRKSRDIPELVDSASDSFNRLMNKGEQHVGETSKVQVVEESHSASTPSDDLLKRGKKLDDVYGQSKLKETDVKISEQKEEIVAESNVQVPKENRGENTEEVDVEASIRSAMNFVDKVIADDERKKILETKDKEKDGVAVGDVENEDQVKQDDLQEPVRSNVDSVAKDCAGGQSTPTHTENENLKVIIALESSRDSSKKSEKSKKTNINVKQSNPNDCDVIRKEIIVKAGLDPLPEELQTAFLKQINSYRNQSYWIKEIPTDRKIFPEIFMPREHSTGDAMTLIIDTVWERLRPTLEDKRVIIYPPFFSSLLKTEHKKYLAFCIAEEKEEEKSEFFWSQTLTNIIAGTSSCRPGKNQWFVDIDRIYAPMNWPDQKHWVGLCIDLVNWSVTVLDCWKELTTDEQVTSIMQPIMEILPILIQEFAKKRGLKVTDPTRFLCDRPTVPKDEEGGNCGPFSVKYIEMHCQGLPMVPITKEMVANFRMRYAFEVYENYVASLQ